MSTTVPPSDSSRETPSTIHNPNADPELNALWFLANALGGEDSGDLIMRQEAAGQRQLVHSDRLPTECSEPDAEYEALGITFGPPDTSDPLFRPATLPAGWKRLPTDHSMWSKIVDQLGRERIAVFYKAAFYDRRADMHLATPTSYLRSAAYNGEEPILDDEWLTREVAVETLTALENESLKDARGAADYAQRPGIDGAYWTAVAAEHLASAKQYAKMRDQIGGAA